MSAALYVGDNFLCELNGLGYFSLYFHTDWPRIGLKEMRKEILRKKHNYRLGCVFSLIHVVRFCIEYKRITRSSVG